MLRGTFLDLSTRRRRAAAALGVAVAAFALGPAATALADGPALPVSGLNWPYGADFSAKYNPSRAGQSITFDGSSAHTSCYAFFSSCAADTWNWDFGDGGTGSGPVVDHAYAAPGTYTVTLAACYCHYGNTTITQTHTVTILP
jgi:PKD repeat protein